MASIRTRYGKLTIDFRYLNKRCRETTAMEDTPNNRKKLEKAIERMEAEMLLGVFDYAKYFPKSARLAEIKAAENQINAVSSKAPVFSKYCEIWVADKEIEWRSSYAEKIRIVIRKYLTPYFGTISVINIKKSDILGFRSSLAKVTYGNNQECLSPSRINQIMTVLRMILDSASDRYDFDSPYKNIKSLKEGRIEVTPFSLEEVQRIITSVRDDFKPYYTIRFFTGMRTSEIDGLQWKNIDLQRREIHIREALVNGVLGGTKTYGSDRTIQMNDRVYQAFLQQKSLNNGKSDFVFCNRDGGPLDYRLVNKRVWHPILRFLGLTPRRAYQTRHTAATLWLSAGENPEWIARQLGHSTTEMLFRVYSRYIPNVTRRDGSAFEAMLERLNTEELAHE
ncbi:Arm DNA-binding domain-containing protein [Acinetobacter ursingii]|uniref:Arm DNA-binding domain-containing protein n=1 Tax=Acinetobacter ursingii TaxID=108980 RepID=UPI00300AE84F